MKRIVIVLVLFAASATASYLIWHARRRSPDPRRAAVTSHPHPGDTATATTATHRSPSPPLPPPPRHTDTDTNAAGDAAAGSATTQPPPTGLSLTFDQEPRDPTWATDQEREMTLRLHRVVADLARHSADVDIDSIECHRTLCRIGIHAASDNALSRLYGALETTEGLYGWADTVLLTRIDIGLDGKLTTAALAQFDRE